MQGGKFFADDLHPLVRLSWTLGAVVSKVAVLLDRCPLAVLTFPSSPEVAYPVLAWVVTAAVTMTKQGNSS